MALSNAQAVYAEHLERIASAIDPASSKNARTIADWIQKNTTLNGKPFSFKDHEYQLTLLKDPAEIKYVMKCSQVGISELSVRRAIALCQLRSGINVIYVLPTAGQAGSFSSTRFSTALEGCKSAKDNIYKTDSAMIKRWLNESYLYMRGASKGGQAISIPCTSLICDEVDFCEDQGVLTSFESRMTHAEDPSQLFFSTPTVEGYGIAYLFENSLQHVEMQKCDHCGHWFLPDYFTDVKLPGFNAPKLSTPYSAGTYSSSNKLADITFFAKRLLTKYDVDSAYLACPKCHRKVNQHIRNRNYVVVNNDSNFREHGYRISPFSAPKHVPPSKMIRKAASFHNVSDFVNNTLGLPFDDATTGLSEDEIRALFDSSIHNPANAVYPDHSPPFQISGTDLGGLCARLTAYPAPNGHIRVLTAQRVPLHKLKEEYMDSTAHHRVISSVVDAMPYTDTVSALQEKDPRLFACIFTQTKGLELFRVREQEEDEDKATFGLRQLSAKKDALLDYVVTNIRAGRISFAPSTLPEMEHIIKHLRDPKRIKIKYDTGEGKGLYVWRKSALGEDHYFLALGYLLLANHIKGLHNALAPLPFLLDTFSVKKDV